jgi:hypothetical protein
MRGKSKVLKRLNRSLLTLSIIGVAAIVTGFNLSSVYAISTTSDNNVANGFSISPVETELTIDKGTTQVVQLSIQNPTKESTVAEAIINDFGASTDESGTPKLILQGGTLPANNFKSLVTSIPNLALGPDQQKTIDVPISVPKDAISGGYYGAIRFVPTVLGQQSNVGLTASVGSLFLITVPGNLIEKVNLTQLGVASSSGDVDSFFTKGPLTVFERLDNVGNIHVAPYGKIELKNTFGHIVYTAEFNGVRGNILPDSIRRFDNTIPKSVNLLGHYTVVANLGYNSTSGALIYGTTGFWVVPVWLIIVAILVVILVIAIIYWIFRRITTRSNRQGPRGNRK